MPRARELGRKLIHVAGACVTVAALGWLAWRASVLLTDDVRSGIVSIGASAVIPAFLAACISVLGLALNWISLLEILEGRALPHVTLGAVYLRTQIGKYLPGNVFHYVLRHALGRTLGLGHVSLLHSAFWEAAVLGVLALLIATGTIAGFLRRFAPTSAVSIAVIVLVVLAVACVIRMRRADFASARLARGPILRLLAGSAMFFGGGSAALYFCLHGIETTTNPAALVCGAFACSWLLGFITPGSPGGVGVRETVLVSVLSPYTGEAQGIVLAVVFRLFTLASDAALWLATYTPPLASRLRDAHPAAAESHA